MRSCARFVGGLGDWQKQVLQTESCSCVDDQFEAATLGRLTLFQLPQSCFSLMQFRQAAFGRLSPRPKTIIQKAFITTCT